MCSRIRIWKEGSLHPHVLCFLPGLDTGACHVPAASRPSRAYHQWPGSPPNPPFLRLEGSRFMSPPGWGWTAAFFAPVVSTGPGATCGNFKKLDVASVSCGGLRHADASSRLIPQCGPQVTYMWCGVSRHSARAWSTSFFANFVLVGPLQVARDVIAIRASIHRAPPEWACHGNRSAVSAAWPFFAASIRTCGACLKSE